MAELYDQQLDPRYHEDRLGLPRAAILLRAAGHTATVSLDEEYDAPPERRAVFAAEMRLLDEARHDEIRDSRGISI